MAGVALDTFTPVNTVLSQTGIVTADAKNLVLSEYGVPESLPLRVSLGAHVLTLVPVLVETNFTVYGADIQNWAGQTAELAFTTLTQNPHLFNVYVVIDDTPVAIPEPGVITLMGLG